MKKIMALGLAVLLLVSGCTMPPQKNQNSLSPLDAIATMVNDHAKKIYVYSDYSMGWNHFIMRDWVGEKGIKPPDMDEAYAQNVYQGVTAIKAEIDFTLQKWGGYIFSSGALQSGDTEPVISNGAQLSGENLTGAVNLRFYAKGAQGGEKLAFFCGGMGHDDLGENLPYADSSPKIFSPPITLTSSWKEYQIPLTNQDISRIGYGFAWVAYQQDNPTRDTLEFYLDEIAYTFEQDPEQIMLLPSYEAYSTQSEEHILNTMAYVNDNALGCIALLRLGHREQGKKIADALVFASQNDRAFTDHRLRNAYACGNIASYPGWYSTLGNAYSLIPGFYHNQTMKWHEDYYAVSSNLTSLAWGILALTQAHLAFPGDGQYLHTAQTLADFALAYRQEEGLGFSSGWEGWEGAQTYIANQITFENMELYGALGVLAQIEDLPAGKAAQYRQGLSAIEDYMKTQFDSEAGAFLAGQDVATPKDAKRLVDNALAILLLPQSFAAEKQQALAYIEQNLVVTHHEQQGFAYCDQDTGGIFWQGTALMALVYQHLGADEKAAPLLQALAAAGGEGGFVPSASIDYLGTSRFGLHDNRPLYFFNRRHLGTTALTALAQEGISPFSIGATAPLPQK